MKIPDKIKIGGHVIDVKIVPGIEMPGLNGEVCESHNLIRLCTDMAESQRAAVLMHEIVELIHFAHGLELEHGQITSLSESLFQVFRDNALDFGDSD